MPIHSFTIGWRITFAILLLALALTTSVYAQKSAVDTPTPCTDGFAGPYPCHNVDLIAHLPLDAIGAEDATVLGNDHWGWSDQASGRDFVIYGLTNGTSFIEVTDQFNPVYLGKLPNHDQGVTSVWRDIKVFANHAYIAGDIPTNDGLQVFDLTQLLSVNTPPVTFAATAHYDQFGPGHNLWINEDSGFLYVFRSDTCNGGIHMVDINDPIVPTFAGCFAENDSPLSDAECVNYAGPDPDYQGREICFVGSDDNVTIGDVTDKSQPAILSQFGYNGIQRAHQGSLTADGRYWLLSDTMDEVANGHPTRTYVIDVIDLDNPVVLGYYEHPTNARDHNVYIVGNIAHQTNWRAGYRYLAINRLPDLDFVEMGFFDIVPESDSVATSGAWSNYPWWNERFVTVSSTHQGLFILQPNLAPTDVTLTGLSGSPASPSPFIFIALLAAALTIALLIARRALRKAPSRQLPGK